MISQKRKSYCIAATTLVVLAFAPLFSSSAQAQPTVLAPHSTAAGKTIGEWSGEWWKWAFSLGPVNNPFNNDSQAAADNGQSGPVYFIAGTSVDLTGHANYGASRTFNVPADKYLLIPLINSECSDLEGNGNTEADLRACVSGGMDQTDLLHATLDGVTIPLADLVLHRETTPGTFSFDAAVGNAFGVTPGHANLSVADGYYLMLAPLGTGTHDLNFGGGSTIFGYTLDVTDRVTAVPEPGTIALLMSVGVCGVGLALRRRPRKERI